jgi:ribonuclease HI
MAVVVYFDGLCEPVNPGGIAAYGFVIYRGGERVHAGRGVVGAGYLGDDVTNNVAEYTALIKALEWLIENGFSGEELVVRGDSQLVIRQLRGEYAVKSPRIAPLYARVRGLLRRFRSVELEWVPRELNAEADALSRAAYEEFLREHPEALRAYRLRGRSSPRRADPRRFEDGGGAL